MYRIVDTIHYRPTWTHRHPHLAARTPGCLVILDLITPTPPAFQGQPVVLHRPAGTSQVFVVDEVTTNPDHIISLYFRDLGPERFVRGAWFTWPAPAPMLAQTGGRGCGP